jgi:hypothetical protein
MYNRVLLLLQCAKVGPNNKLPHLLPKNTKIYLPGMGCLASTFDGEDDEMTAWAKKQRGKRKIHTSVAYLTNKEG